MEGFSVAIDGRFLDNPGLGRYVANLIAELPDKIELSVVVSPDQQTLVSNYRPDATCVVVRAEPFSIREQFSIPLALRQAGVDVFHATQFTIPLLWSGPIVTTIHDCAYDRFPSEFGERDRIARWYYRTMMRYAVTRSNHVIAVSESTRRDLAEFYGLSDRKVSVIYEGIDPSFADSEAPREIESEYVLYVGSERPRKNLERLLGAYDEFSRGLDEAPRLVLVGEYESRFLDVEQRATELGIRDNIVVLGFVSDDRLKSLYANALALVFPSLYEGFGLPVLEAMAAGTPVVAADAASIPEVAGDAAEYVNPNSVESIATGLSSVLDDDHRRAELVEAGFERVKTFDWERTAAKTAKVYREYCG
jgi:glycosyltransferase involved in cell wall biosynthesis